MYAERKPSGTKGGVTMGAIRLLVILSVVAFIGIMAYIITTYNQLIRLRNKVRNSFAQVDAQLQRRFDLVPNLVEIVKGYVEHEEQLLESMAARRSGYLDAGNGQEKLSMSSGLTSDLKVLYGVAENYPELKSNGNFIHLQQEFSESEDKVTFARQFYNDAVTIYNNKLQMFPGSIIAGLFGFEEEALFAAEDEAVAAPTVQF